MEESELLEIYKNIVAGLDSKEVVLKGPGIAVGKDLDLEEVKFRLNESKKKTSEFKNRWKWRLHTEWTHPLGKDKVMYYGNQTRAYLKMMDLINRFPKLVDVGKEKLRSFHMCENPGNFVCALGDFLDGRLWEWKMNTLNPYYEWNNPDFMLKEDSLILSNYWIEMGDILELEIAGEKIKRQSDFIVSKKVEDNKKKFKKELEFIDESDLDPHVYEGGLKVWECSYDLAEHLKGFNFKEKNVLELGCGAALPSIVAAKKGAKRIFCQDYNQSVIELVTKPNLELNSIPEDAFKVFACSWEDWSKQNSGKFDLILTSETIYDAADYQSLHDALESSLSDDGEIFLAAKMVYFGKTGDYFRFLDFLEARNVFEVTKTIPIEATVKRVIVHLKRKK
ncbi:hypothetical protein FO519_007495 [Halicephalobus sp. NKZ332]|nr:hypothetical protein FO519_007495 [Halicephalobus sp. NKZ332]